MINKIAEILCIPIIILNFVGGIVGGIWLAFLGEWKLIGIGILLLFTFHWVLAIFMMPSLPLAGLAALFFEKNNPLGYVLAYISQLYTNLLVIGTCALAFFVCSSYYTGSISFSYMPYLLWSWGMALGPWQYFASKEPDNEYSAITLFSASVFYLLFIISMFIGASLAIIILVIFGIVQLIVLPTFNIYFASKLDALNKA